MLVFGQGVNLGGWLILEEWMTGELWYDASIPSGEFSLMTASNDSTVQANLRAAIVKHRQTFITEQDFINMDSWGINAVRIPVGHWLLKSDPVSAAPYIEGAAAFLDA